MFDKNDFIQFLNLWSQHIDLLYDKSIEHNPCYRHIMKQKARYTPEMVKEIFGHLSKSSRVQKKVEKREEFTKGKSEVPQMAAKKDEPMFFDDII